MMTHGKNPEGHARGWEPHALPGKGVRSRSGAHSLRELRTDHVRPHGKGMGEMALQGRVGQHRGSP